LMNLCCLLFSHMRSFLRNHAGGCGAQTFVRFKSMRAA
jgi:hypothetical protein